MTSYKLNPEIPEALRRVERGEVTFDPTRGRYIGLSRSQVLWLRFDRLMLRTGAARRKVILTSAGRDALRAHEAAEVRP